LISPLSIGFSRRLSRVAGCQPAVTNPVNHCGAQHLGRFHSLSDLRIWVMVAIVALSSLFVAMNNTAERVEERITSS